MSSREEELDDVNHKWDLIERIQTCSPRELVGAAISDHHLDYQDDLLLDDAIVERLLDLTVTELHAVTAVDDQHELWECMRRIVPSVKTKEHLAVLIDHMGRNEVGNILFEEYNDQTQWTTEQIETMWDSSARETW